MIPRLLSLATADPPHRFETAEIAEAADRLWLSEVPGAVRAQALRLLRNAEIRSRYSVVPLQTVFSPLSFAEKNDLYVAAVKDLAARALRQACEQADIAPRSLDYVITSSCTGFMIPSVDAYLVEELGLSTGVVRLPVTEMGCAGGAAGLLYASRLLEGRRGGRAAVIAVEAPSVTFQRRDHSAENLVSTAIFADGAACAILGTEPLPGLAPGPALVDSSSYHFPGATEMMGYRLTNDGLKIVLAREAPDVIAARFPDYFFPLLERNGVSPAQVRHFAFHPGGKKIVQAIEALLAPFGGRIDAAREVLRTRGNLSSATVFYVLEECLRAGIAPGDWIYLLAFGPGFTATNVLLRG